MPSLPALRDCDAVLAIDGAIHICSVAVANEDRRRDLGVVECAECMEISGNSLKSIEGLK